MAAADPVTATRSFLEDLYATADAGYLAIFHLPSQLTTWVPITDLDLAAATIQRVGQAGQCYFGVGIQPAPLGTRQRGTARSVSGMPGLFMDIDLAGGAHAATTLPATISDVSRLVRTAIPLEPSLVVWTGGGVHGYWLFKEFLTFDSDTERTEGARLNRALQAAIIGRAREHGWTLESTADLARVLRPPGTFNRKRPTDPVLVETIHDSGKRYGLEEIEAHLPTDIVENLRSRRSGGPRVPGQPAWALWNHIVAGCPFLAHCVQDRASLSEPEWHAMMTVVGRCRDGEAIAHEVSQDHPGYDPAETDRKFDWAARNDAPVRCQTVRYLRGGERWCARCPHWQQITSPIVLGYPRGYVGRRPDGGREESACA